LSGSFFECAKTIFDGNSLVTVLRPSYSPDLALSDFWLFGHVKTSLAGRVFNDTDEFVESVIQLLNENQHSELQLVSQHWIERVKWVLANNGDYHHEEAIYPEFALYGPFWKATATTYEHPIHSIVFVQFTLHLSAA
jgi:hypothetical protein